MLKGPTKGRVYDFVGGTNGQKVNLFSVRLLQKKNIWQAKTTVHDSNKLRGFKRFNVWGLARRRTSESDEMPQYWKDSVI